MARFGFPQDPTALVRNVTKSFPVRTINVHWSPNQISRGPRVKTQVPADSYYERSFLVVGTSYLLPDWSITTDAVPGQHGIPFSCIEGRRRRMDGVPATPSGPFPELTTNTEVPITLLSSAAAICLHPVLNRDLASRVFITRSAILGWVHY